MTFHCWDTVNYNKQVYIFLQAEITHNVASTASCMNNMKIPKFQLHYRAWIGKYVKGNLLGIKLISCDTEQIKLLKNKD